MAASRFSCVKLRAQHPMDLFALDARYNDDTHPHKVNLGIFGAFRTEENKPWVLPVVHGSERQMAEDTSLNHEYLPVLGLPAYREAVARLLLGNDSPALIENRVECAQSLGGTGALRIGLDFCKRHLNIDTAYVSSPTWSNHVGICKSLGYGEVRTYRYWNAEERCLDIKGMVDDITNAPASSVVILHACAHNPTGVDPTHEQWHLIAQACQDSGVFVLMDIAYQGFSTGDLEVDAYAVRLFERKGFEFFVAQSFSKNFGLYNERVGNLAMILSTVDVKPAVQIQMEFVIRRTWSNPPSHGARIVATILNNTSLLNEWRECVKSMAERILLMRKMLYDQLKKLGTPGSWGHIISQTGMFSFTGLNERQVDYILETYHVYAMKSGRINMCGMTTKTVEYVASAIHDAVEKYPNDYVQ